jgi:hypothetical protein
VTSVALLCNQRSGSQIDIGVSPQISPSPTSAASPNGTVITTSTAKPIIDASGDSWTLLALSGQGLQIAVNGRIDASTANDVFLELLRG